MYNGFLTLSAAIILLLTGLGSDARGVCQPVATGDTTRPRPTALSITQGTLVAGDVMSVEITYDEPVCVTGEPRLSVFFRHFAGMGGAFDRGAVEIDGKVTFPPAPTPGYPGTSHLFVYDSTHSTDRVVVLSHQVGPLDFGDAPIFFGRNSDLPSEFDPQDNYTFEEFAGSITDLAGNPSDGLGTSGFSGQSAIVGSVNFVGFNHTGYAASPDGLRWPILGGSRFWGQLPSNPGFSGGVFLGHIGSDNPLWASSDGVHWDDLDPQRVLQGQQVLAANDRYVVAIATSAASGSAVEGYRIEKTPPYRAERFELPLGGLQMGDPSPCDLEYVDQGEVAEPWLRALFDDDGNCDLAGLDGLWDVTLDFSFAGFGSGRRVQDLVYAQGKFIAVGLGDTIFWSDDGLHWSPAVANPIWEITHMSVDTISNPSRASIEIVRWTLQLTSVAYGNGRFVAVGNPASRTSNGDTRQKFAWSDDGINWKENVEVGILVHANPIRDVTFGGGYFYAVGDSAHLAGGATLLKSADGLHWERADAPPVPNDNIIQLEEIGQASATQVHSVVYANGGLFIPLQRGPTFDVLAISRDGGQSFDARLVLNALNAGIAARSSICGDGNLDEGEGCDDGNEVDGDGCSSRCERDVVDVPISRDAKVCATVIESNLRKLSSRATALAKVCEAKFIRRRPLSPGGSIVGSISECAADGGSAQWASSISKMKSAIAKACDGADRAGLPKRLPFLGSGVDVARASEEIRHSLISAIYGAGDGVTISQDKPTALCHEAILGSSRAAQQSYMSDFGKCVRITLGEALKQKRPVAADSIRGCVSAWSGTATLQKTINKACTRKRVTLGAAFSHCEGSDDAAMASCISRQLVCGICGAINAVDGLAVDCDLLDDGMGNATCSATVP